MFVHQQDVYHQNQPGDARRKKPDFSFFLSCSTVSGQVGVATPTLTSPPFVWSASFREVFHLQSLLLPVNPVNEPEDCFLFFFLKWRNLRAGYNVVQNDKGMRPPTTDCRDLWLCKKKRPAVTWQRSGRLQAFVLKFSLLLSYTHLSFWGVGWDLGCVWFSSISSDPMPHTSQDDWTPTSVVSIRSETNRRPLIW